ncbi:ArnT family glycosyltransferase [Tardiphaga sp. 813_E8_N1_3]|uniref:ArnT family glycosyltransferase n=1 Tax=Tardiphaga sp. 813_E8_N1_3 TaxID=3240760 RepID=UPI003F228A3E
MSEVAPPLRAIAADDCVASPERVRTSVYLGLLLFTAAYFLIWPIWRAQFLVEIWPTEAWNPYFQNAAVSGGQLYPDADSLVGNNYPPLSFYVVGFFGNIFGDSLFAGRALSLFGLICVAVEIFAAVRILSGNSVGAAVGAFWYVAIMAHNSTVYVGANDPQIAGQAIMGAGLVWFLSRERDRRSVLAPLLLMVVGGFWKHNMIGIPTTVITWMMLTNWRAAIRPVLISGAAASVGLFACSLIFGPSFFSNIFATRHHSVAYLLVNIGHLQWCAPALAIWAGWAITDSTNAAARFSSLHIGISFIVCILQWFGSGVSGNAEFDLILALGVGTGLTFSYMDRSYAARFVEAGLLRTLMIAVLLIRLIASDRQESALILISPEFRESVYSNERAAIREAAQLSLVHGDVFCTNKVVCRMAGKPFVVDEFKVEQLALTNKLSDNDFRNLLALRNISVFRSDIATTAFVDTSLSRVWWQKRSAWLTGERLP